MRAQWWDWCAAARDLSPNAGVFATAMGWASLCWDWRRGDLTDDARSSGLTIARLAESIPGRPKERAIRGHFATLVAAGLLEVIGANAPGQPKRYAPVLPGHTGTQLPLSRGNTGTENPVSSANTGTQLPEHRHSVATAPFTPEVPDPPSHAYASGRAREDAPTRGANDEIPGNAALVAVLDRLEDRHGAGMAAKVAPGYRQHLARGLALALVVGWRSEDLADRLTEGSMRGVGKVGAVLCSRLSDLANEPPPETARQRAERRAAAQVVTPCDHGTPAGCSGCFMCRRAAPDDDGVICGQCSHRDELIPAGYTPALEFPTESPTPEGTP